GADQRHEANAAKIVFVKYVLAGSRNADQPLLVGPAERHDQAPADFQLQPKRLRRGRNTSGDQNGIEWRLFRPTETSITGLQQDVVITQCPTPLPGRRGQTRVALDGKDFARQPAEDGSGVT